MSPYAIVKVLSAAAPIVASVASVANSNKPSEVVVEKKDPPVTKNHTNNITINIVNNFNVSSTNEASDLANRMQGQLMNAISSGTRYTL